MGSGDAGTGRRGMRKNARMADNGEFRDGLAGRVAAFDREAAADAAARAEVERLGVVEQFPLKIWAELPLEQYALGPTAYRNPSYSFCRLMEYGTNTIGSIRGGSAAKHILYQHRSGEWRIVPTALRGLGVHEAWEKVRAEFEAAFDAAAGGRYELIDELESLSYGQALTTKALAVYFPGEFLPIFSASHVRHFTALLGGRPHQQSSGVRTWRANRELLELVRQVPEFGGWLPHEVMEFLYTFHDPRPKDRVIWKIAPGERAALWDDCLTNRRIRIGWDEVGSLTIPPPFPVPGSTVTTSTDSARPRPWTSSKSATAICSRPGRPPACSSSNGYGSCCAPSSPSPGGS